MKHSLFTIIAFLLLFISCLTVADDSSYPTLNAQQAIEKAQQFVSTAEQNTDLKTHDCFITKVEYRYLPEQKVSSYWSVFWGQLKPGRRCFGEIRVFEEGTVLRVLGY